MSIEYIIAGEDIEQSDTVIMKGGECFNATRNDLGKGYSFYSAVASVKCGDMVNLIGFRVRQFPNGEEVPL